MNAPLRTTVRMCKEDETMRQLARSVTALILVTLVAVPALAAGWEPLTPASLLAEIRALRADVREVERETQGKKVDGREVRKKLDRVSDRLEKLERSLERMNRQPAALPMDDASFRALLQAVERARFSRDRIGVVSAAASTNLFAAAQVERLLQALTFSSERLDALRLLWPRVLDKQNGWMLHDDFPFGSERRTAEAIIAGRA